MESFKVRTPYLDHYYSPQCTPSIFNLDQKFHGLSCFWGIDIHETVQNQSRKTSVIRLPKFTTVNMARKCHQRASFSTENLFFEDYSIGSLKTDVFLTDYELLYTCEIQKARESMELFV